MIPSIQIYEKNFMIQGRKEKKMNSYPFDKQENEEITGKNI